MRGSLIKEVLGRDSSAQKTHIGKERDKIETQGDGSVKAPGEGKNNGRRKKKGVNPAGRDL